MSRVVAAVGDAANAASKYTLARVGRHLIVCICILRSILYVLEYKWRAPRDRACMLLIIYYDSYVTYSRGASSTLRARTRLRVVIYYARMHTIVLL